MHSSFSSKLTYTKALYCFSSAWLFAQGAIATASGMNGAVADSPCIIHNSPNSIGNEQSYQVTVLVIARVLDASFSLLGLY